MKTLAHRSRALASLLPWLRSRALVMHMAGHAARHTARHVAVHRRAPPLARHAARHIWRGIWRGRWEEPQNRVCGNMERYETSLRYFGFEESSRFAVNG